MYHNIPYDRNFFFIGREHILREIDSFFAPTVPLPLKIVSLVGMPGIGKTEVALEYAYRTLDQYQAIIWLNASARWQMAQNIARVLNTFSVKLPEHNDDESIFQVFRHWLRQHQSHFLLVLDQIGGYSFFNDVLDEGMVSHVLVTRSSYEIIDGLKYITVKSFDKQESSLFLLHRANLLASSKQLRHASREVQQAAFALHTEFGGHPLALDQAGAYVEEMGITLIEYLARYRKDRPAFLDRRGTASASHPFSTYVVIAAMRQGAAYFSQELLFLYVQNLLDCSDPYPQLPPTLHVSDFLRQQASELFGMRAALIQNFLIVPSHHKKWDMHPLVRAVMLEILAYEEKQDRLRNEQDEICEPLDEEGIFQILVEVQHMRKRVTTLPRDDPERMQLARSSITMVRRLTQAILPAPREQRWQASARIEERYSTFALDTASQNTLRGYARELLELMQYR
jgi:hypothetical protein